jgi:hypothetical protein
MSFLIRRRQTDRTTLIFWACVSNPPPLFRSNVRVESKPKIAVSTHSLSGGRVVANILIALPLFEIANVLARFDHVSNFIVNAAKFNKSDIRYAFVTENGLTLCEPNFMIGPGSHTPPRQNKR